MLIISRRVLLSSIRKIAAAAVAAVIAAGCATVVTPTGGPKDETPPVLTGSVPGNNTVKFKGDKLVLNFSEYISLKDLDKYLLVSPPLTKAPDIKVKGRSLLVKLPDTLRSNTTYNFYFGNAVVDITEGNPLRNFNFAFSTGPTIDSLSISGVISDAFTRLPVKDALVMLHSSFTDSVPRTQIPVYVSRADESGRFRIGRLAQGHYRLMGLKDENSNYLYDLPNEQVAFVSDTVSPVYVPQAVDTLKTLTPEQKNQVSYALDLFHEPDSIQRVEKSGMATADKMYLAFRFPTVNPAIKLLLVPDTMPWCLEEWSKNHDTLQAWLLYKPDTLAFTVTDVNIETDTLQFATKLRTQDNTSPLARRRALRYTFTGNTGVLDFNRPLMLTFANPVKNYFPAMLRLARSQQKDTVAVESRFTDSLRRHLLIDYKWSQEGSYKVLIPKGAFADIYGNVCDSGYISFKLKPREEYGTLEINLSRTNSTFPLIVQLLGDKDVVISEIPVSSQNRIDFGILPPGKYRLKAIVDRNGNGRWDTGVLKTSRQPETIIMHPKTFDVKPNWELEEEWKL